MNKIKRKLRKLVREPKLFFTDMHLKHSNKFKSFLYHKYNSNYKYAIISAIYNAEKYLDDYFSSITKQSLDFKKHIQIICVDDGSTDGSANIIKKWKSRYPENITYIYKENGGQGSARNVGLLHLKNADWVSFMDSDDFLDKDYFYHVDKVVANNNKIKMVCCNQIYYFEDKNQYIDRHPLNYRFKIKNNIVPCNDLGKNIQFSAALSFLKVNAIPSTLKFDEELKPTFEDGKFVNTFLLHQSDDSFVYFQPKSRYLNRKRADKSSTMDGVWQHKGQFSTVFERGYLDILPYCYKEKGFIPKHLQRSILWEMLRLVKQFLNHEERLNILLPKEKEHLLELMDETFKYIDKDTILSYELGNCGFSRQLGMLGCFKNLDVDRQVAYIDKIDFEKKQFLLRYFSCFSGDCQVTNNEQDVIPIYYKESRRKFLSRTFLTEYRLWLPFVNDGKIEVSINGKPTVINFKGKRYKNSIPVEELFYKEKITSNDYWLFMDRDDSAGDNAEFLYSYVQENKIHDKIFFVLNNSSSDWKRLKNKNFNLIKHGSRKHKDILQECSLVISSQIGSIINPFSNLKINYKTIFLQHGVIKDDLSSWLNNVNMDIMLTSSRNEYESIANDGSTYIYGKKEIKLTGLPRFDSLYANKDKYKNQIAIMFTWRKSLAGTFISNNKSERKYNNEFVNSYYYKMINELINSHKLKSLAEKKCVKFVFIPHPNMKPYLNTFNFPNYITPASDNDTIHNIINESAMLVTDFSSVAFDFAYQNKPVCYYQFDKKEFFNGEHTYTQGYFDYERDGFGPVYEKVEDVIVYIEDSVKKNYKNKNIYSNRIKETFPNIDDRNCERVTSVIANMFKEDLSTPYEDRLKWLSTQAKKSFLIGNYAVAANRYRQLLSSSSNINYNYLDSYIRCLIYSSEYQLAIDNIFLFENYISKETRKKSNLLSSLDKLKALIKFYTWNLHEARELWKDNFNNLNAQDIMHFARCLFLLKDKYEFNNLYKLKNKLNENEIKIIDLLYNNLSNNDSLLFCNISELDNLSEDKKNLLNFDLVLAEIFYLKNEYFISLNKIVSFERYSKNPFRRLLISLISFSQGRKLKVLKQIDALNLPIEYFGKEIINIYKSSNDKE